MANALYAKGREGFLDGSIDWDTNDIRAILIDAADYTVNLATHDNLDDIAAAARVAVSGAMTGKTVTDGVADADDVTWTSVTGDVSRRLSSTSIPVWKALRGSSRTLTAPPGFPSRRTAATLPANGTAAQTKSLSCRQAGRWR